MVSMIAPPALVAAPARLPLQFGLGSILGWRTGDRFESGVAWEAVTCDPADAIGAPQCLEPPSFAEHPQTQGKNLEGGDGPLGQGSPFTIYGHWSCLLTGNTFQHAAERAAAHLYQREEAAAEYAFWTGDLGNIGNLSAANGFPEPDHLGDFEDGWLAVASLEGDFARQYGAQGILHMSRRTATILFKAGELRVTGGRITTPLGTPVIAGTGYGDDRIVITGPLIGYRSEVFTHDLAQLDRASNTLYAIAERSYVIGVEECALMDAEVHLGGPIVNFGGAR